MKPSANKQAVPRTFRITTLGCKVNQFESADLAERLRRRGWRPAAEGETAEVHIVNSCTVTGRASTQSRQAVRRAVREAPCSRVVVTGCYAQTRPEELAAIEGIAAVVGHEAKFSLAESLDRGRVAPARSSDPFTERPLGAFAGRTRPFLKIQDGCDAFCSYCIVPYARGRSRSMPAHKVLEALERYHRSGYREVVLCGIHLGAWGQDLAPAASLAGLLADIDHRGVVARVRLSSIEPRELTGDIVARVAASERFCRHFHIPLQSGDDDILRRMKRPYDAAFFARLVNDIHRRIPDAGIGVDVLVGFPGESEAAFENTRRLIASLPVTYLHVFPFSPREGTPAATFAGRVDPRRVRERCRVMRELGATKRRAFYRRHIGREVEILVEARRDAASGLLKGVSTNYIPVRVDGGDELKNRLVRVRCRRLDPDDTVTAEIV